MNILRSNYVVDLQGKKAMLSSMAEAHHGGDHEGPPGSGIKLAAYCSLRRRDGVTLDF